MIKLCVFLVLVAGLVRADAPYSITVGTNSTQLVARKPLQNIDDWAASTAYAQGAVVKSGLYYYFATAGGTSSTNAPTATTGSVTDGTVTWQETDARKRNGVVISVQTSGGKANLSFGTDNATTNTSFRLVGEGHAIMFSTDDQYQSEIQAISADGSDVILGIQEL